jgi:uroporphyrinogen-III synthase
MRLLVTRPLPDARRQADALAALGHTVLLAPLLAIEFARDVNLPLAGAQALIVTSRNALRALSTHPQRDRAISLPLVAVGDATAREAESLGFSAVTAGAGTAESLVDLIHGRFAPASGSLVHLAGETLAFDLKAALEARGFTVSRPVLYRAVAADTLPDPVIAALAAGSLDGVILMSPRTATLFVALLRKHEALTEARRLRCYCLAPAVAAAAAPLKALIRVARAPREEDILALISADAASS